MAAKPDPHRTITDRIVEQLEHGVKPWACPWLQHRQGGALPVNHQTGDRYHGINIVVLWLTAQQQDYTSNA